MAAVRKPKSVKDLKNLLANYKGVLSPNNVRVIEDIVREMEKSGGQSNSDTLKSLMNRLAKQNGVQIPRK